jgi:hypothetical protein
VAGSESALGAAETEGPAAASQQMGEAPGGVGRVSVVAAPESGVENTETGRARLGRGVARRRSRRDEPGGGYRPVLGER